MSTNQVMPLLTLFSIVKFTRTVIRVPFISDNHRGCQLPDFRCECYSKQTTGPNYRRTLTKDSIEKGSGTVCVAVYARYMDRGLLLNIMI